MGLTLQESVKTFEEKFQESGRLCEEGGRYIPGGYSRHSLTFGPHAIYVDHGEGQYLFPVDGQRLLDFHNNFSCSILGHDHPHVREAIQEIAPKGFSFGNPMKHEFQLARMLCERIESVERVIFSCSASESCLSAIRIARANTGKGKVAKFEGGYHGLGDDFMVSLHPAPDLLPGPPTRPVGVSNTAGIPSHIRENVVVLPQNDLASCEKILRENVKDVACVIMELQTGAGGVLVMEHDFVQGIRAITEELGIVLIVDETITLRADYHGMQHLYNVRPDLTVMGKIIGGGMPLGAVGGQEKYFRMGETGMVYHSGTHHGHPLSTIAGIACLEVLTESVYERLNAYGQKIKDELTRWVDEKKYPFFVYGLGSHLGYEIADKPERRYTSCRDILGFSDEMLMQTFAFEMVNRGIFPMYRGQIALSEPMTEADIDMFINLTKDILSEIFDE